MKHKNGSGSHISKNVWPWTLHGRFLDALLGRNRETASEAKCFGRNHNTKTASRASSKVHSLKREKNRKREITKREILLRDFLLVLGIGTIKTSKKIWPLTRALCSVQEKMPFFVQNVSSLTRALCFVQEKRPRKIILDER